MTAGSGMVTATCDPKQLCEIDLRPSLLAGQKKVDVTQLDPCDLTEGLLTYPSGDQKL